MNFALIAWLAIVPVFFAPLLISPASGAGASSTPKDRRLLVIPSTPLAQELSDRLKGELTRLEEQDAFAKLGSWKRLPEVPAWVFEKKFHPEIAFPQGVSVAMDAFRHTVVIGRNRPTIVIRTGGIAGVYEIYEEPKKQPTVQAQPASETLVALSTFPSKPPNKAPEPTITSVTPRASSCSLE